VAVTLLMLRPRVLYELNRRTLTRGSVLGALLGIGFVLCTVGMQTTSVLISAFVIGTTVVLAPLIAWVWLGHRLTIRAAAAMSLAFVGLAMITVRGFAVGPGTLLILAAAVLWAAHLVALERWSRVNRLHVSRWSSWLHLPRSLWVACWYSKMGKDCGDRCRRLPRLASFSLGPLPPAAPSLR
jgi:drug/metabolite transporter (DMT)-like permease